MSRLGNLALPLGLWEWRRTGVCVAKRIGCVGNHTGRCIHEIGGQLSKRRLFLCSM